MQIKIKNENLFNIRRDFGIYLIRCIPENRIYIGSTKQSFRARFSNHCKFLQQGKLSNVKLQKDYNIYGSDSFEFEIITISNEESLVQLEQNFIDNLKPYYNINLIAINKSRTNLNRKFSEEHKQKIREKSKLFRHKNMDLIIKQNKEGAAQLKLTNIKTNEVKIGSVVECSSFIGLKLSSKYYEKIYKDWLINKIKSQSKKVKLLVNNNWIEFSSCEKCDKFLNKWRGFTSTQRLRNSSEINGYTVEFI